MGRVKKEESTVNTSITWRWTKKKPKGVNLKKKNHICMHIYIYKYIFIYLISDKIFALNIKAVIII